MPLTELYNIDWRETSFVPEGDNPPARIVFWKDQPDLSDEEIMDVLDEVENEGSPMNIAMFTKRADLWREITKAATKQAAAEAATEGVELTPELISAVRGRIVSASEELQQALSELPGELEVPSEEPEVVDEDPLALGKAARPYAELHRVAKAELPALYRKSPSAAVAQISSSRPDLVADYSRASRG